MIDSSQNDATRSADDNADILVETVYSGEDCVNVPAHVAAAELTKTSHIVDDDRNDADDMVSNAAFPLTSGRTLLPSPSSLTPAQPAAELNSREASTVCSICIADWEEGDIVTPLPCKHEFHLECIGPWLEVHRECPYCKQDVFALHLDRLNDNQEVVDAADTDDDLLRIEDAVDTPLVRPGECVAWANPMFSDGASDIASGCLETEDYEQGLALYEDDACVSDFLV